MSRDETRVKVKDVNALEGVNVTRVRVEKVEKYGRKKGGTVVNAYTYSDPAISRYVTGANLVGWSRQASEVETSGNCDVWYNGGQGRVRDSSPVGLENLRMPLLFPSPVTRQGE